MFRQIGEDEILKYLKATMEKLIKLAPLDLDMEDGDDDRVRHKKKSKEISELRRNSVWQKKLSDEPLSEVSFEDFLFLRIAFEFSKFSRGERTAAFLENIDKIVPDFDTYQRIFLKLLGKSKDRFMFAEWLKFSLELNIADDCTRKNLVSLMFNYIGQLQYSFQDYEHLLKGKMIMGTEITPYQEQVDNEDEEMDQNIADEVIEIEVKGFQNLGCGKTIEEYCKPFCFESFVRDSDDVC